MSQPNDSEIVPDTTPILSSSQIQDNQRHALIANEQDGISPVISESPRSITIRRPVQYHRITSMNNGLQNETPPGDEHAQATLSRYKYYSKLDPQRRGSLMMPNHVVPSQFFMVIPIQPQTGTQSSIITIFSIWNTMMGTSLLSMPWAIQQAGFASGIVIIVIMAGLTLYTAYRVMNSIHTISLNNEMLEFTDVCQYYLGRWGQYTSIVFSLFALLGAAIVYWVLMSNFLYHTVLFVYEKANNELNSTAAVVIGNISYSDAYCPHPPWEPAPTLPTLPFSASSNSSDNTQDAVFHSVWDQYHTTPFFLILVLAPLINFKSPTFFTKFNALGTVSVAYIVAFVIIKAYKWGIHLDFEPQHSDTYINQFEWTFPALTGTLSLALFIHNCVISIVRNQQHPENNVRDLSIAYICVAGTYLFIGVLFYSSFPLPKTCIEDNLLNNLHNSDLLTFVARVFLFFQMVTVFPLLMYIMRAQFMHMFFGDVYPSLKHVMVLNAVVVAFCLIFAVFLPEIGTIIRFSGALCGLTYIFALPCLIYMLWRKREGTLTWPVIITHSTLIFIGVANFVAQFIILAFS